MADTAFQKYYGKPAFANYGRANTKPTFGGSVYGNFMKTHNMNPHRFPNDPTFQQVYQSAQIGDVKAKETREFYDRDELNIRRTRKQDLIKTQVRGIKRLKRCSFSQKI